MNHTEKFILNALNSSGKIGEIKSIKVLEDSFQQGILGNLKRIQLDPLEDSEKLETLIYKMQNCTNKTREGNIYKLISDEFDNLSPLIIHEFKNGDLLIEDMKDYCSGKIIDACHVDDAKKVLLDIGKVHSFFWNNPLVPVDNESQFADVLSYNLNKNLESYLSRYTDLLVGVENDFDWLMNNTDLVAKVLYNGKTLTHGDLHLENIMFSNSGDIRFIDWQLGSRRSPAFDVSFFIVQNIDWLTRRNSEKELLEVYYMSLSDYIKDEYSFDRFYLEYRACLTRSMMTSVMMIGERFSHKDNYLKDGDVMAKRVISAVKDLNPVEAIMDLIV